MDKQMMRENTTKSDSQPILVLRGYDGSLFRGYYQNLYLMRFIGKISDFHLSMIEKDCRILQEKGEFVILNIIAKDNTHHPSSEQRNKISSFQQEMVPALRGMVILFESSGFLASATLGVALTISNLHRNSVPQVLANSPAEAAKKLIKWADHLPKKALIEIIHDVIDYR